MIYVMSQKFFKKKIEKMAKRNPYFGLDGENWGVTGHRDDEEAIATKYNNVYSVGSFSPEARLFNYLKDLKKGRDVPEGKLRNEVDLFLKDKAFISSVNTAFKTLVATGTSETRNVFVILPNIVYKYLGKAIVKRMRKLGEKGGLRFTCVYTQDKIDENKKCLDRLLTEDELEAVDRASKWIERHYDLRYSGSSED